MTPEQIIETSNITAFILPLCAIMFLYFEMRKWNKDCKNGKYEEFKDCAKKSDYKSENK